MWILWLIGAALHYVILYGVIHGAVGRALADRDRRREAPHRPEATMTDPPDGSTDSGG